MKATITITTFLAFGAVAAGKSHCPGAGGPAGNRCGSDFSHFDCPGTCCHDDFNAWCCPAGDMWKCHGNFGGGSHCDVTNACRCTQENAEVIKVEAAGQIHQQAHAGYTEAFCCAAGDNCVATVDTAFQDSTTMSWQQSTTLGMSVTIGESLVVESASVQISLSHTWTNGQSKSHSVSLNGQFQCNRVSNSKRSFHETHCAATKYTLPVKITYMLCGKKYTAPGTVTSVQVDQYCGCGPLECPQYPADRPCYDFSPDQCGHAAQAYVDLSSAGEDSNLRTDNSRKPAAAATADIISAGVAVVAVVVVVVTVVAVAWVVLKHKKRMENTAITEDVVNDANHGTMS